MAKKITKKIKLQIQAAKATPPPQPEVSDAAMATNSLVLMSSFDLP